MRILTVRQPWAWAIVHGGKDVENRVRNIAGTYRGPVAIHVAQAWDGDSWDKPEVVAAHVAARAADGLSLPERQTDVMDPQRGCIIGVVDLVDVHRTSNTPKPFCVEIGVPNGLADAVAADRRCESPWAESDAGWHLVLENPRPLAEPIPYRGALGLRVLYEATADLVGEQLRAAAEEPEERYVAGVCECKGPEAPAIVDMVAGEHASFPAGDRYERIVADATARFNDGRWDRDRAHWHQAVPVALAEVDLG